MEHPPKQGLKHQERWNTIRFVGGFNGTSTKTRIETLGTDGLAEKEAMF